MAKIENPKSYTGRDLETIFFRPMLTGPDATSLGIKIMYNMPVPTTLQFWKRAGDILQKIYRQRLERRQCGHKIPEIDPTLESES